MSLNVKVCLTGVAVHLCLKDGGHIEIMVLVWFGRYHRYNQIHLFEQDGFQHVRQTNLTYQMSLAFEIVFFLCVFFGCIIPEPKRDISPCDWVNVTERSECASSVCLGARFASLRKGNGVHTRCGRVIVNLSRAYISFHLTDVAVASESAVTMVFRYNEKAGRRAGGLSWR